MRQSKLFIKTEKEAPADEVSKNAELLIRGGFINKEMAGVYSYLPLGLRVMNKISNIVREEMDAVGGQEIKMTVLQDSKPGKSLDVGLTMWWITGLKQNLKMKQSLGLALLTKNQLLRC